MQLHSESLAHALRGKVYGRQLVRFRLPGRKSRDCNIKLINGGSDFVVYDHRHERHWRALKDYVRVAAGEQPFQPRFEPKKLPILKRRVHFSETRRACHYLRWHGRLEPKHLEALIKDLLIRDNGSAVDLWRYAQELGVPPARAYALAEGLKLKFSTPEERAEIFGLSEEERVALALTTIRWEGATKAEVERKRRDRYNAKRRAARQTAREAKAAGDSAGDNQHEAGVTLAKLPETLVPLENQNKLTNGRANNLPRKQWKDRQRAPACGRIPPGSKLRIGGTDTTIAPLAPTSPEVSLFYDRDDGPITAMAGRVISAELRGGGLFGCRHWSPVGVYWTCYFW